MSEFTVHTGALRTMADSCTAAARAVESVCADLPPAARTLADRLESDTAALRRLADAAEEIAALYELAEQRAAVRLRLAAALRKRPHAGRDVLVASGRRAGAAGGGGN